MRNNKYMKKIAENLAETYKNKLYATALIGIGIFSTKITGDATFLVFIGTLSVVMFFSKENWIS